MTSIVNTAAPRRRLDLVAWERVALAAFVAAAAAVPWLAPRPPMVDLPQHAAQVALWRDLIRGVSPWSDLVAVHLATPYLIGYGLMLPLTFVLPAVVAAKLVLSAAILAFAAASVALRRAFGGDPRLDWLAPAGLFGYAWQWGFLTFITAAPLGLVFLVAAQRQATAPSMRHAMRVALLGGLCLFAHALIFLMAGLLGGLLALRALWLRRGREAAAALWPYVGLAILFLGFRLATGDETSFHFDTVMYPVPFWLRPITALGNVTEASGAEGPRPSTLLLLLAPLALRLPRNREGGVWLFGGLVAMLLALPFYAFETAGLVDRFALFVLPFTAVLFGRATRPAGAVETAAAWALAVTCCMTVGLAGSRVVGFARESRDFETVLAAARPGRRGLALVAEGESPASGGAHSYMHWPAWYGAEKGGFVDFNFAAFPPQVVRFRPARRPAVTTTTGWYPETFDWSAASARDYDEIFIRGDGAFVAGVRAASPCALDVVARKGSWTLLERGACP